MKLVFFALHGTFDFQQVGGTDSYMRRLIEAILECDPSIEIICCFYDAPAREKQNISTRLAVWRFTTLNQSLNALCNYAPKHIVLGYVRPQHLPLVYFFQRQNTSFLLHKLLFFHPGNGIFRFLKKTEYSLLNYSGVAFAASERIQNYFAGSFKKIITLPPIIPSVYFCNLEEKHTQASPVEIVFLGRTDPRKGIIETIQLFEQLRHNQLFNCKIVGIHINQDPDSVYIHRQLSNQSRIPYYAVDRQKYDTEIEKMVIRTLRQTDIFLQPYHSLSSTVDMPLLILEAMASGCAIMTTNQKPISNLFENNPFLLPLDNFVQRATNLLLRLTPEQLRIEQNKNRRSPKLAASQSTIVAKRFLEGINGII